MSVRKLMAAGLAAGILLTLPSPVWADDGGRITIRDSYGKERLTLDKRPWSSFYNLRDSSGRRIGSMQKTGKGEVTIRGEYGRVRDRLRIERRDR